MNRNAIRRVCHLSILLACAFSCTASTAQSKHSDEPPLVGTVMFSTSSHHDKLDINTASKRQLSALPGLAAYSDKIIACRPYSTKLDLVKRGVIPQAAYDKVKDRIIAHRVRDAKSKAAHSATTSNHK